MTAPGPSADEVEGPPGFGRGMVQLAGANAAYIVTAYAVTTITARVLSPGEFGSFGVVMAWVTVLTALLVKGLATTTAREMASADPATGWHAGRSLGIRMSAALAVFGVAVSPLAAPLFGSKDLAALFAVGALGALTFGTNAVLLAWPTGTRSYGRQAVAQLAYAIARVLLVVGGAVSFGLEGAVVGYVLAPLLAAAPLVTTHPPAAGDLAPVRARMWRDVVPIALVSLAVTAYFVVDVFALSAAVGASASTVGTYVAYGTVAHVPFFLLQAASVAVVPELAATRDAAARAAAIRRTMTDMVVLLAGPTFVLATAGDAAARVVFGRAYDTAGLVVLPLALATGAVTLLANLVAIDVAVGRLRTSLAITLAGAALVATACWYGARIDADLAAANAAWAALAASGAAAAALAVQVRVRHGALLDGRRAGAGLVLALAAAAVPLAFDSDVGRLAAAAFAGVTWLAAVLRLRLVDVRRRAMSVDVVDAEHA